MSIVQHALTMGYTPDDLGNSEVLEHVKDDMRRQSSNGPDTSGRGKRKPAYISLYQRTEAGLTHLHTAWGEKPETAKLAAQAWLYSNGYDPAEDDTLFAQVVRPEPTSEVLFRKPRSK
jgi:hypothetical protein